MVNFSLIDRRNYRERFGVIAIDLNNKTLTRTVKNSAKVVMDLFKDSVSPFTGPGSGKNGQLQMSSAGVLAFALLLFALI